MAQSKYFCPCGALTQDLFYKCNKDSYGRQTHHMPGKYQRGRFQNLRKVCPQCDAHFSKCKRHPQLGYQPWRKEQRVGRQCKARMWVLCCERCEDTGTAHVSSVLCPGCKVRFSHRYLHWFAYDLYLYYFVICCRLPSQTKDRNGTRNWDPNANMRILLQIATSKWKNKSFGWWVLESIKRI